MQDVRVHLNGLRMVQRVPGHLQDQEGPVRWIGFSWFDGKLLPEHLSDTDVEPLPYGVPVPGARRGSLLASPDRHRIAQRVPEEQYGLLPRTHTDARWLAWDWGTSRLHQGLTIYLHTEAQVARWDPIEAQGD